MTVKELFDKILSLVSEDTHIAVADVYYETANDESFTPEILLEEADNGRGKLTHHIILKQGTQETG